MDGDDAYLQPGFNASSLTMPRLRGILTEHSIDYPSGARKAELVSLFVEQVQSRASEILAARASVEPNSDGIENVGNAQSKSALLRGETSAAAPKDAAVSPRKRARSKKSDSLAEQPAKRTPATDATAADPVRSTAKRVLSDENMVSLPAKEPEPKASPSKRKRASPKKADAEAVSKTEPDLTPKKEPKTTPKKKAEQSMPRADPAVKTEEAGTASTRKPESGTMAADVVKAETPSRSSDSAKSSSHSGRFSDFNVFQSPLVKRGTPRPSVGEEAERRKSRTPPGGKESSRSPRAKFMVDVSSLATSASFGQMLSRSAEKGKAVAKEPDTSSSSSGNVSGDLSGDVEDELVSEQGATRAKPWRLKATIRGVLTSAVAMGAVLTPAAVGVYNRELMAAGYCGVPDSSDRPLAPLGDDYRLECVPCPPHALCLPKLQLVCDEGYVYKDTSFLGELGMPGFINGYAACVPDTERASRIRIVADEAAKLLRDKATAIVCGLKDLKLPDKDSAKTSVELLRNKLYEMKSPSVTDAQFDDLWNNALRELLSKPEISIEPMPESVSEVQLNPAKFRVESSDLSHLPFFCQIRQGLRRNLERYRFQLGGTLLSLAALAYARYSLRRQRALANAVKGLTAQVLERLCQQAAAAQAKPGSELPAYLSSTRLRDYYLKQMPMAQRNAVWQRVSNAVEADSDVRVRQLELQGEIHRVWEWMGDVASPGFGSPAPLSPSPSMATMSDTSGWQVA